MAHGCFCWIHGDFTHPCELSLSVVCFLAIVLLHRSINPSPAINLFVSHFTHFPSPISHLLYPNPQYQTINSINANIGFNAMEYWFQSLYSAILYAYTPEAFPAPLRGSASGCLSTLGRIASILAPIAAGKVYTGGDSPGVLYLAVSGLRGVVCDVVTTLRRRDSEGVEVSRGCNVS